jgi:pyruvate/2-oxoglutarate dehydrogenase complex dihydrolipoamide acyltransferase (E2) component
MGQVTLPLPKLGLTMEEGTVLEWHVAVGDEIEAGAEVVTIETDKVDNTVESPCSGRIAEILVEPGTTCDVGTPLCLIEES